MQCDLLLCTRTRVAPHHKQQILNELARCDPVSFIVFLFNLLVQNPIQSRWDHWAEHWIVQELWAQNV